MAVPTVQSTEIIQETYYPSSDGQPMEETTVHIRAIMLLFQSLEDHFHNAADVFVAADLFWYWEEGNPNARKAPDVMVVRGVDRRERRTFLSWQENNTRPCTVFEMASAGTWREDLYEKIHLYARLGVPEYFLFDPEAQYLRPALQGFRRSEHGVYVPLEPDGEDRIKSEQLGLYLRAEGPMLRLIEATTGQSVLAREEHIAQQKEHIARLEAMLAEARGKAEPGR